MEKNTTIIVFILKNSEKYGNVSTSTVVAIVNDSDDSAGMQDTVKSITGGKRSEAKEVSE